MSKTVVIALVQLLIYMILAKKTLRIDLYEICRRGQNVPVKIHNVTLQYTREGGFSFCGEIELYRDMKNEKLRTTFVVQKCASREALDTCEQLSPITPPSTCRALDIQGLGANEFREGFEPPFRCPFKKGIYKIKNATLNPEVFTMLPLEGYYWKLNASAYEDKLYIGSMCFHAEVIKIRN